MSAVLQTARAAIDLSITLEKTFKHILKWSVIAIIPDEEKNMICYNNNVRDKKKACYSLKEFDHTEITEL